MAMVLRCVESCLLVAMGAFMAMLSQSSQYWQFLNPKYSWLTCFAGVVIILLGFGSLLNVQRRPKLSELAGVLVFLGLAFVSLNAFEYTQIQGEPFQNELIANNSVTEPVIVEDGVEYVAINVAELFQQEQLGHAAAGQAYAVQGTVVRTPELDKAGYIAVGRLLITCCFADSTAVLSLVKVDDPVLYTNRTWVQVLGVLEKAPQLSEQVITLNGSLSGTYSRALALKAAKVTQSPIQGVPFVFEVRETAPFAY